MARRLELDPRAVGILDIHFYARRTDGVSLEMAQIRHVLTARGMRVVTCASDVEASPFEVEAGRHGVWQIPELAYDSEDVRRLKHGEFAFESAAERAVEDQVSRIHAALDRALEALGPIVFAFRNMAGLPIHPAATIATARFAANHPDLPIIAIGHDFRDEDDIEAGDRLRQYVVPYPAVQRAVDDAISLLLAAPNVRHVVISRYSRDALLRRTAAASGGAGVIADHILHDCIDFDQQAPAIPGLRAKLGIGDNDFVLGNLTRIAPRKAIEVAAALLAGLRARRSELSGMPVGIHGRHIDADSRFILLLAHRDGLDEALNAAYFDALLRYASETLGVEVSFVGDQVVADAAFTGQPGKYPFNALYGIVDVIAYASYQEGFGNQLLEAVALGRGHVVAVHGYPVYVSDIRPHVPDGGVVWLGDNADYRAMPEGRYEVDRVPYFLKVLDADVLRSAVDEIVGLLGNPDLERARADSTFRSLRTQFDARVVGARFAEYVSELIASSPGLRDAASR